MGPTAPAFFWVLIVSASSVSALLIVVAAAFSWHHRQELLQAQEWGRHLLGVQETERGQLARDLHDDVIQRLWSARLASQADRGAEVDSTLNKVIEDLRSLAHDLHPPALLRLSLGDALRDLAGRHFAEATIEISIGTSVETPLDRVTALALYRVAQEATTNITKHADATHVRLSLAILASEVRLEVEDNGVGLGDADVGHSFGLRGMHERIETLGGRVTITSGTKGGVVVSATVPIA